jgi:photosystem II stability/assembly factor-like uncharacterized protein
MKQLLIYAILFISFSALGQWGKINLETDASFRSMEVFSNKVIWAGGTKNTVLKSINGGKSWDVVHVPATNQLDFRGIKAFDKKTSIVVSAGLAEEGQAKIYKTNDGGESWILVFETSQKGVFLDGIAFFDKMHGLVIGDPINNQVYILETKDGGNTWQRMDVNLFPPLKKGEASFAASNSCLVTFKNHGWYAFQSRILHTANQGQSWEMLDSKFPSGPTKGIFGLHFSSETDGVALGGDYKDDKSKHVNFSITSDSGITWNATEIIPNGLKESAQLVKNKLIVVGTSGTSISSDKGKAWEAQDKESFHVVDCAGKKCYAIGANANLGWMRF